MQQAKLLAGDRATTDLFGRWVALSADGSTAIISSTADGDNMGTPIVDSGAAYVFTRSESTWTQQAKLIATDQAASDFFGISVALSADGNTAIVGAYGADDTGAAKSESGAAYVFSRSDSTWTQDQKLTAMNSESSDYFGISVGLSPDGSTAIVGAQGDDDSGDSMTTTNSGAAYVFTRTSGDFTQQAQLLAATRSDGANFGVSVALSDGGDTAIVGANGEDDATIPTANSGAAYVFVRSGETWALQQQILSDDRGDGDTFGRTVSLSLDGNTALIGATFQSDDSGTPTISNGAAYVFTRESTLWSQQAKLLAPDKGDDDRFGVHVSLAGDGNLALIGARTQDDDFGSPTTNNGAAYVFARSGASWIYQAKLLASDKANDDSFGFKVALSQDGKLALIGSLADDDDTGTGAVDTGSAYVFVLGDVTGTSCETGAQCITGFCADGVCCTSSCGDSIDDDCQACSAAKKQSGSESGVCGAALSTVVCRGPKGICDATETCDGRATTCPEDAKRPTTYICRQAGGVCDVADTCDNVTDNCPADKLKSSGMMCKAAGASAICDPADVCDGKRKTCPSTLGAPGLFCGAGKTCKLGGNCS